MAWLSPKGRKRQWRFEETSMRFIPQHKCWGFLAWIHVKIGDYVEAKIGNKTYLGKVDKISKHFVDIRLVFNGKTTVGVMRFPKNNVTLDTEGKSYAEFL